jgi:hypothetical protein
MKTTRTGVTGAYRLLEEVHYLTELAGALPVGDLSVNLGLA